VERRIDARRIALSLPEATEEDHFGRPSFRVGGKIFATLWTPDQMNVMLDMTGILDAVEGSPGVCAEFRWGKRVRAVQVDLRNADGTLVRNLLEQAWRRKAPRQMRL
jgi:hypothetical protein